MKRNKQDMELDTFNKLLNDYIVPLEGNRPAIIFHINGEPLFASNWEYMVREVSKKRPDAFIDIYTNGILLDDKVMDVLVSLPSSFRVYVSFHFRMKNSSVLVNYKDLHYDHIERSVKRNARNVEFIFVSHLHDGISEDILDEWKSYWEQKLKLFPNRVGGVHINPNINPWGELISDSHCVTFASCCYENGEHLFVGNTGNVLPCCLDLEEEMILGNIMIDSKEQIMENRNKFYSSLSNKETLGVVCRRCLT